MTHATAVDAHWSKLIRLLCPQSEKSVSLCPHWSRVGAHLTQLYAMGMRSRKEKSLNSANALTAEMTHPGGLWAGLTVEKGAHY